MKIIAGSQYAANVILGVFGGTSFYAKVDESSGFDKTIKERENWNLQEWQENTENLLEIFKKIQTRQYNQDDLNTLINRLFGDDWQRPLGDFFIAKNNFEGNYESVKGQIRGIVEATSNNRGFQNTKVSKILHILAPNLIPMIDAKQGKFILDEEDYNNQNRDHLMKAFDKFHESFAKTGNRKNIKQISKQLNGCNIKITELRIFELLIWLQTQYKIKKIKMELVK